MISEDKFTEIFCIADDFNKVFDAQMEKYMFKAENHRTNLPQITEQIFHKSPKITKNNFGR